MKKPLVPTILLLGFACLLLAACQANEDEIPPESTYKSLVKLMASDTADGDSFGYAVAVDGDRAIVGAPSADGSGTDRGRAYLFLRNQGGTDAWGEIKILSASDDGDADFFGAAVDISGDYAVVGAGAENGSGTDQGAAYVYYRNQGGADNWGQVKKLTASDRADNDGFGYSVSIDGETILVGSDGEDGAGTDRGAAYVFLKDEGGADNWGEVIKLVSGETENTAQFGFAVALDGDYALVGAPREDGDGTDRGAAYLFARDLGGVGAWGMVKRIVPADPSDNSWFGNAVAVDGALAVVGEAWYDGSGTNRGAAYVLSRDLGGAENWGQAKKLTASDISDDDFFGYSVAVNGMNVAIGAGWAGGGGTERGQAYIFSKDEGGPDIWGEVQRLRASDGSNEDWFSFSIGIAGTTVLVGAVGEDGSGTGRGAAYVFKKS